MLGLKESLQILREELIKAKEGFERSLCETIEFYGRISIAETLGIFKEEELDNVKCSLIASLVSISLTQANIKALGEEIEALTIAIDSI